MSKSIKIRNVPESLRWRLKARAALEGVPMFRFALRAIGRAIGRALARPSRREWLKAIAAQPETELDRPPADILREERILR